MVSKTKGALTAEDVELLRELGHVTGIDDLADRIEAMLSLFTREGVELLRDFARNWHPNDLSDHSNNTLPARNRALGLAARIEALLPPEE